MKRQTFQRALHAWPEWDDSIERSQKLLGYDPAWPRDTCISWIEKHYPEIRKQAEEELKRLELPPTLREYWEDCFHSEYETKGSRTDFSKIISFPYGGESLPELPCSHEVGWDEGEDVSDPWLLVEIRLHGGFATRELFDYAAWQAYEAVKISQWRMGVKKHPVCRWLRGGRPPADEKIALECVHLKDDLGWYYKDIGRHYDWPLQHDSYGNLNQCNTARYYVKWGRDLRKKYQQ